MNHRHLSLVIAFAAFVLVAPGQIATPLERPETLAGRATLSDKELSAMKKKAHELFSGQGDAAFGDSVFNAVWANITGVRSEFTSIDGESLA